MTKEGVEYEQDSLNKHINETLILVYQLPSTRRSSASSYTIDSKDKNMFCDLIDRSKVGKGSQDTRYVLHAGVLSGKASCVLEHRITFQLSTI